ncbi:MAG: hypothetical protein R3D80_14505 [Paracoccaceae bacterium]
MAIAISVFGRYRSAEFRLDEIAPGDAGGHEVAEALRGDALGEQLQELLAAQVAAAREFPRSRLRDLRPRRRSRPFRPRGTSCSRSFTSWSSASAPLPGAQQGQEALPLVEFEDGDDLAVDCSGRGETARGRRGQDRHRQSRRPGGEAEDLRAVVASVASFPAIPAAVFRIVVPSPVVAVCVSSRGPRIGNPAR